MPKKEKSKNNRPTSPTIKKELEAFLEEQKKMLRSEAKNGHDSALKPLQDHIDEIGKNCPKDDIDELYSKLNLPASPTIREELKAFLAEQKKRLKPKTYLEYEGAIGLFQDYIDSYGHDCLSEDAQELYTILSAKDDEPALCDFLGPDRIVEHYTSFLNWFMVRKVITDTTLKKAAGRATKKLSAWLEKKGYITHEAAIEGAEIGTAAVRYLPKAEKATQQLYELSEYTNVNADNLEDADYLEFSEFTITKIQRGKLWLEGFGGEKAGPIEVPPQLTNNLEQGWGIACSLGRHRRKWYFIETANVCPH